jgi:hypothetical protein
MMPVSRWKTLQLLGLLSACFCCSATSGANTAPEQLPAWSTLEFKRTAYGTTARSQLSVSLDPGDSRYWQLDATSSIAQGFETVTLRLEPGTGRVLDRSRLSRGRKDQRYKRYSYLPDYIVRERRVPGKNPASTPANWTLASRQEISYPPLRNRVVTSSYALLLLAARLGHNGKESEEVVVHTDRNFYAVTMRLAGNAKTPVNYRLAGKAAPVTGEKTTRSVVLRANPEHRQDDQPDFDLLGLSGTITLQFETVNGLPVSLTGVAPRIGKTTLMLAQATLRNADN